jgi:hypothetical protein
METPEIKINYDKNNIQLTLNITNKTFYSEISNKDVVRYLKGVFTNKSRFEERFVNLFKGVKETMRKQHESGELDKFDHVNPSDFECDDIMNELLNIYDKVKPFTYTEAFKLKNQEFQAKVFGSINISDMISSLGHERIKTEGKAVRHKQFDSLGNFTGYKEYDVIYEVHKVNGSKLGTDDSYAIKCWCTTTNKEHWLWIEDKYKDNPLEAVASTFRIHENLIPHIKELKRQGDVLLVEMHKDVEPEGEIIPLNAEQYFSLLTAQS